jgi:VIT1/CCC1 family predicted Fe2+/Mn2+ transporter
MRVASTSKYHPLHAQRRRIKIPLGATRFLAAFEGIEGGFAIGASILVALWLAGLERHILLATALISITVNGFNSSSVKYSSEHYLDELDGREKKNAYRYYLGPAVIEFVSYFAISLLSILPLLFVPQEATAIWASVIVTVLLLFGAGFWRGYMLRTSGLRDAIETVALGAGIIAVGVVSGIILHSL